eukprot:gene9732-2059_t
MDTLNNYLKVNSSGYTQQLTLSYSIQFNNIVKPLDNLIKNNFPPKSDIQDYFVFKIRFKALQRLIFQNSLFVLPSNIFQGLEAEGVELLRIGLKCSPQDVEKLSEFEQAITKSSSKKFENCSVQSTGRLYVNQNELQVECIGTSKKKKLKLPKEAVFKNLIAELDPTFFTIPDRNKFSCIGNAEKSIEVLNSTVKEIEMSKRGMIIIMLDDIVDILSSENNNSSSSIQFDKDEKECKSVSETVTKQNNIASPALFKSILSLSNCSQRWNSEKLIFIHTKDPFLQSKILEFSEWGYRTAPVKYNVDPERYGTNLLINDHYFLYCQLQNISIET